MVEEKYQKAENTYAQIKEEVRQRALALDEAVSQSAQVRVCLKLLQLSCIPSRKSVYHVCLCAQECLDQHADETLSETRKLC